MSDLQEQHVVSCFLQRQGKILLVKRSQRVGSYQGAWSAISGYLDPPNTPLEQALIEVFEETGITSENLTLLAETPLLAVDAPDYGKRWIVHPFLFEVGDSPISLDWENLEYRWVTKAEIELLTTVPRLMDALNACLEHTDANIPTTEE